MLETAALTMALRGRRAADGEMFGSFGDRRRVNNWQTDEMTGLLRRGAPGEQQLVSCHSKEDDGGAERQKKKVRMTL